MLSRVNLGQNIFARNIHYEGVITNMVTCISAHTSWSAPHLRSAKRVCFVALPVSRHGVLFRMRPWRELQVAIRRDCGHMT